MSYVNVGAKSRSTRTDIPTKAALKRTVKDNPSDLLLYGTSMFDEGNAYTTDNMVVGDKYSVVGPKSVQQARLVRNGRKAC